MQAMERSMINALVQSRAEQAVVQTHLVVDYYRIRRRIAVPLPVKGLLTHTLPLPFQGNYPWDTWLAWALEERLNQLGCAACWSGSEHLQNATDAELRVLADWERHGSAAAPSLVMSALPRVMLRALREWRWLAPDTRRALAAACQRACDQTFVWYRAEQPGYMQSWYRPGETVPILHNIPALATFTLAAAARAIAHPLQHAYHAQAQAVLKHYLAERLAGHSEGWCYDGLVLDYLMDWLDHEPPEERAAVLDHPALQPWARQIVDVSCPGDPLNGAPIGDVEPEMLSFPVAAAAKLHRHRPIAGFDAFLAACELSELSTDALAAIRAVPTSPAPVASLPADNAVHAQYAVVLRSGRQAADLAVAISCAGSEMDHLHCDAGSLVLGTAGRWLIADPGYQQYLDTSERQYTVGPAAHNCPLVNGQAQTRHGGGRCLARQSIPAGAGLIHYACIDMTAGYPPGTVTSARRHVWLIDRTTVLVADDIDLDEAGTLEWHWHGHPDVAWCVQEGRACLYVDGESLWLISPDTALDETGLERLRGSRGQLTLKAQRPVPAGKCRSWWAFHRGAKALSHRELEAALRQVRGIPT